jgi:hypothetical protein
MTKPDKVSRNLLNRRAIEREWAEFYGGVLALPGLGVDEIAPQAAGENIDELKANATPQGRILIDLLVDTGFIDSGREP